MSINWTDRLEKLEKALTDGLQSGTFSDGRSFNYKSQSDLLQAIEYARKQQGQEGASAIILTKFSKGVQC
jgi:hypothetical protein